MIVAGCDSWSADGLRSTCTDAHWPALLDKSPAARATRAGIRARGYPAVSNTSLAGSLFWTSKVM